MHDVDTGSESCIHLPAREADAAAADSKGAERGGAEGAGGDVDTSGIAHSAGLQASWCRSVLFP